MPATLALDTSAPAAAQARVRPSARAALRILWPHVRRHWWLPAITLVTLLVSSVAQIGLAWSLKLVVDAVTGHDRQRLYDAIAVVVALGVLLPLADAVMQLSRSVFGGRVARELKDRVFGHLLLAPAAFHDGRHSGELQSRLSDDVGTVESMVTNDIVNFLQQPLLALGSFAYVLSLNGRLALAVSVIGPGLYLLNRLWGPSLYARSRRAHEAAAALSQFAVDALGGVQPIKALRAEGAVAARFRGALAEQYGARLGEWLLSGVTGTISGWLGFAPFVIVFALGGIWVVDGRLTLGTLVAVVQLMNNIVSPFGNLAGAWRGIQTGRASVDRIGELLAVPEEPSGTALTVAREDPVGQPPPPTAQPARPDAAPAVAVQGVRFGYDPAAPVLTDASVAFTPGAFTAVVGPNGGGKSTLAKLLLALYKPQAGEITWDGRPQGEWPLALWRARIAYLPQEAFLIDASVADNLRLGAPAAAEGDLRAALDRVGLPAADPGFLAMRTGERGKRLSGGQCLRLGLARALLSDARLWILDEPSAALDPEATATLRRTLRGLHGTHTVIVISHSSDLIAGADRVVRVAGGTVTPASVPAGADA